MNKCISNKIKYLYLILTIGMVMYHAKWINKSIINYLNIIDHKSLNFYYRFANHIGYICLVFFFFMSSFWLYKGLDTKEELKRRLKKTIHTLLIPYILWFLIILFYSVTYNHLSFHIKDIFTLFFTKPIDGPLWYILGLLILQMFSPLILYIKKDKRITTTLFSFVIIYLLLRRFNLIPTYLSFKNWWWYENLLNYTPIYLIGAYFGIYYNELIIEKEYKSTKYTIIGIILLIVSFLLWHFIKIANYNLEIYYSLIEVLGIWFILKPSIFKKDIPNILNCNFYIYALHAPILIPITQKYIDIFVTKHIVFGIEMIGIKIIQIIIIILLCIITKYIASKVLSQKANYYLTGGR